MKDDSNIVVCCYLGLASDASISRIVATSAHRCHRWATPQTVEEGHQTTYCLSGNYVNCPWFVRPGGSHSSRRELHTPVSSRRRAAGAIALLSILLLLFAVVRMFILPVFQGGDQVNIVGGLPAQAATAVSAAPEATSPPVATAQPTLAPTATMSEIVVDATATPSEGRQANLPVVGQPTVATMAARISTPTPAPTRYSGTATPISIPQATPPAGSRIYEVQSGDTLYGLAINFGVTVEDIMRANGLTDRGSLSVGQKLVIPSALR